MTDHKTCPTCGTDYDAAERFCPVDGSALRAPAARTPREDAPIAHRPSLEDTQFTPVYRRRPGRRMLPALIAVAVVAIIGAGAVYARRPPVAPAPAAAPASTGGPVTPDDSALEAALVRDWARHVESITPANAGEELARAERLVARPRTAEPLRLQAMYVQATSLGRLGRHDEECSTLRRIRDARAFDGMGADFRQRVAQSFVTDRGSCQ